jgi:hypothetical protein
MRDAALWIYYYLNKKKLLNDPDHQLLINASPARRGSNTSRMSPRHKRFLEKVFGAIVYNKEKLFKQACDEVGGEHIDWAQKRTDHVISAGNYYNLNSGFHKRIGTITRHGDDWGGHTAPYPKVASDGFRDHCLGAFGIKPEIKRRVLYVPRESDTIRFLRDKNLESLLDNFCQKNNFEFVRWANNTETSVEQQMRMYSESAIIVGGNGTDFVNSYWTNEEQLLIEIVCADRVNKRGKWRQSLGALGGFSGFCSAFRSESIDAHLASLYGENYPRADSEQLRDWHIVQTPDENTKVVEGYKCVRWYRSLCKVTFETSEENRIGIQSIISKWLSTSSKLIS